MNILKLLSGGAGSLLDDPKVAEFLVSKGIEWVKELIRKSREMEKRVADLEAALKTTTSLATQANERANRAQQKFLDMMDRVEILENKLQSRKGSTP